MGHVTKRLGDSLLDRSRPALTSGHIRQTRKARGQSSIHWLPPRRFHTLCTLIVALPFPILECPRPSL
jgi:hypothetical protein